MSLMSDYEKRTAWKHTPVQGRFQTHPGLLNKIGADGTFCPFMGSTVVFRLDKPTTDYFRMVRQAVVNGMKETFSEPFPSSTFHMTLHDLVSPEMTEVSRVYADETRADYSREYRMEVEESLDAAGQIVERIRSECAGRRIMMHADRVVNMVSKSLVLMLKPATEEDFRFLTDLYHRFDGVKALPYPLTPHVTLAYFRPGEIDGDALAGVIENIQVDADDPMPLSLSIDGLAAQRYWDMARYEDVPFRVCFVCDGGMNRSVMAAAVLNQIARERGIPVRAEARAAFWTTEGEPVSYPVKEALRRHGISFAELPKRAQYLNSADTVAFDGYVAMTGGAVSRIEELGERACEAGALFRDLPDPQYGASYDGVYNLIHDHAERLLDALAGELTDPAAPKGENAGVADP